MRMEDRSGELYTSMRTSAKFTLLLCCLPALMGATVYRWVDDNGVVNYTQQQPANVPSERVVAGQATPTPAEDGRADEAPATGAAAPAQPPADRLTDAQREALKGLESAEQARQQELTNIREANCERAQGVLDRLMTRGRIRVRDDAGNDQAMAEEERQQRISEAQRGVVENCVDGAPG